MSDEKDGRDAKPVEDGGTAATEEARTPEQSEEGGTSSQEDETEKLRAENEKLRNANEQLLGQKSKWEQREQQSQAAYPPTGEQGMSQAEREYADYQQRVATLQRLAKAGDPVAMHQLDMERRMGAYLWQQKIQSQLAALPSEERKEAEDFYMQNQSRFADVEAAYEALKGRKLSQREAEIKKREEQLRQAAARSGSQPVSTATVSVGAEENKKRKMTLSEYRAKIDSGGAEAFKLRDDKDAGRIEIDYGG